MSDFGEFMGGVGALVQAHPFGFVIAVVLWCLSTFAVGFMTAVIREWRDERRDERRRKGYDV